jgi:hypothetical protein
MKHFEIYSFSMKTRHLLFVALAIMLLAVCASPQPSEPDVLSISLSGDNGAPFTGFYMHDGQRIELSGTIPWTFAMEGVSHLEVRKTNPNDSASVEVHYKSHKSDFSNTMALGPGIVGARVDVRSGFAVTTIKE